MARRPTGKSRFLARDERGFSLIEVIIAGAVLLALVAGTLQVMELQQKMTATSEAGMDTLDFVNQIRSTLAEPEACKQTFGGMAITGAPVTKIVRAYYDPATATWSYTDSFLPNQKIGNSLVLKSFQLLAPTPPDGSGTLELTIDRVKKGVMGGVTVVRNVPLAIKPSIPDPTKVGECYAFGGGAGNPQELIDDTPVTCMSGSKVKLVVVGGKIKVECSPCTPMKKWTRYDCTKNIRGMNWINTCYYTTACTEDPSTIIGIEEWDGLAGPTNASGGDTGTRGNCHDRRRKCAGEP